jgi:hypothetical protein
MDVIKQNRMVKISLQTSGSHICIGIQGKKDKIRHEFYSFVNYGAASECHMVSDTFLYFWTTYYKLEKAFIKRIENDFYNRYGIEFKSKFSSKLFEKQAKQKILEITREKFIPISPILGELEQNIVTSESYE